jgi:hypothetical protein
MGEMGDEDGRHLAAILQALSQTDTWAARTDAGASRVRRAPDSPLGADDAKSHPHDLSHAAWRHLSNAVDHLGCLRAVLADAKVIHMYAPFTLVRGALENACGAIWLLEPSQRTERLARLFRQAIADIGYEEQARKLLGEADAAAMAKRIADVRAIAGRAGIADPALKGSVSYSGIVAEVDKGVPGGIVLLSWKTCSGFAHGDWWTTKNASRRTLIPGPELEGIGTFKIEANLSLLAQMTALAVELTRRGWELYDLRSLSPYSPPPARIPQVVPAAFRSRRRRARAPGRSSAG